MILDLLALNPSSYNLKGMSITLHIPSNVCEEIIDLLVKYGFVLRFGKQVEINPSIKQFIISTTGKNLTAGITPLVLTSISHG